MLLEMVEKYCDGRIDALNFRLDFPNALNEHLTYMYDENEEITDMIYEDIYVNCYQVYDSSDDDRFLRKMKLAYAKCVDRINHYTGNYD